MTLIIDVSRRVGNFALEVRFESAGRFTALFGPSGSGKSTVVNLIAGLIRPDTGRIEIDGKVLVDTEAGVFVPIHRRRIGYVFQDGRLFPHLSVRQNLRFGTWFTPAAERSQDFGRVVDLLGIGHLLERRPGGLSGGEKQRVAIGRALLASPRLLLMDEPLAALDETRKAEIMPYLERLRDESRLPIVYVSHAVSEVARLAADIVVLRDGEVAASGPAAKILPRREFLPPRDSGEAGALLEMEVVAHEPDGLTLLSSPAGEMRLVGHYSMPGGHVRLRVRARDVIIATELPVGLSALNILPGKIADIGTPDAPQVDVTIDCGGQKLVSRITRHSLERLGLEHGTKVYAVIKTVAFDNETVSGAAPGWIES